MIESTKFSIFKEIGSSLWFRIHFFLGFKPGFTKVNSTSNNAMYILPEEDAEEENGKILQRFFSDHLS